MSDPTTTLEAFQHAVLAAVRAHFGSALTQSGIYDPSDEATDDAIAQLQTPAILIGIDALAIDADDADGTSLDPSARVPLLADCYAQCWLGTDTPRFAARLPEYAGAMQALVYAARPADPGRRGNRWGLGDAVGWPADVEATPAGIDELHGRYAWIVTWRQTIYTDGALPA